MAEEISSLQGRQVISPSFPMLVKINFSHLILQAWHALFNQDFPNWVWGGWDVNMQGSYKLFRKDS